MAVDPKVKMNQILDVLDQLSEDRSDASWRKRSSSNASLLRAAHASSRFSGKWMERNFVDAVHSCNSGWLAAPILYCIHRDRLSNRTPQPKSLDHHIRSHLGIGNRNHNPFDPQQHFNRFSRLTRPWNWIDL